MQSQTDIDNIIIKDYVVVMSSAIKAGRNKDTLTTDDIPFY